MTVPIEIPPPRESRNASNWIDLYQQMKHRSFEKLMPLNYQFKMKPYYIAIGIECNQCSLENPLFPQIL